MIIELMLQLIYIVLNNVLSLINVPSMPDDYSMMLSEFLKILDSGANFFSLVFPINITPFFVIVIVLVSVEKVVPFIVWIIRKIPLAGIS